MERRTHLPNVDDLKKAGIPNAETIFEIQEKSQKAYSKSLELQKGSIWLINGYSLKPNAIEKGFKVYQDMIMEKGDGRNNFLYGELKETLRKYLARWIGSNRPQDIAFGINATTFITQVLSNYWGRPVKILTSNEEFYGTTRVVNRLKEIPGNLITEVSTEPFEDFFNKVYEEACKEKYDVVILSHVHFKSANVLDNLDELITKLKDKVDKIVIDGSCAFGNIPVDKSLGSVMDDIYYIGGIYKFVGAGEGFAFMSLPKNCQDRPVMTGWLFGDYTDEKHYYTHPLYYAEDGDRYTNSTLECSIWVRVKEIIEYFDKENLTVEMKNLYTQTLQDYMVKKIDEANISFISNKNLVSKFGKWRPLQTCYDLKNQKITAKEVVEKLEKYNIYPDFRGDRLRLCPPIYHTIFDIDYLVEKLKEIDSELDK